MKWKARHVNYGSDYGRGRFHRESHGQPRQLQLEFALLPGWLQTANQLAKESQSRQLKLKLDMLPAWLRTANDLTKKWLHMNAFAPIFFTRALWFADRLLSLRSKISSTHKPSTINRGLIKTGVGSIIQLHWSNVAQEIPNKSRLKTPSLHWDRGGTFNICKSFGAYLQPHKRYPGSPIFELEREIREVRYFSSVSSTKLAINVRTPFLWRPPKGCQSTSFISLLAVALACGTHQVCPNAQTIRKMSCPIIRRAFNVQRRLEMSTKVSHAYSLQCNI